MNKPNKILCFLTMACAGVLPAIPLLGANSEEIRQNELRQQQIRTQTQGVADQIDAIIDAYTRNGMTGEEVQMLTAVRDMLSKLSKEDMQQVVSYLQAARSDNASAGKALRSQKTIIIQMKAMLLAYQKQQALQELSLDLQRLAERQNRNLKLAVDLAKQTGSRSLSQYQSPEKDSLTVQEGDQEVLKGDVANVLVKITSLTKDNDAAITQKLTSALAFAKEHQLQDTADSSFNDLKTASLFRAATGEKSVRDNLYDMARLVAPSQDEAAALKAAIDNIDKAIAVEKTLVNDTKAADLSQPESAEIESRQADAVDAADRLQKDLENLAPKAAVDLKKSEDNMQDARASLNNRQKDPAAKNEQAAVDKLQDVKKDLQEQLAKAQPADAPKGDKVASLQDLLKQVQEMIKAEQQLAKDSGAAKSADQLKAQAPKQAAIEDKAQDTQKQTAADAPDAAASIAEAAQQMDKAQTAMADKNPTNPADQEQAAIDALKKAEQQLQGALAKAEDEKKELAAAEEARDKVADLIKKEEKVQQKTENAAAQQDAKKDADAKPIAADQQKVAADTQQAQADVAKAAPDAAKPLEDAKQQMDQAKTQLDNQAPKDAAPDQKQAMADLNQAKDALDKKIDDLQKDLGQQPDADKALADAAKQIQDLQQEVAKAEDKIDAADLQQQQQQIADALKQMEQEAPKNDATQEAQKAAEQAAQDLAKNDNKQAAQDMAKAQQAMQQAAAQEQKPAEQGEPKAGEAKAGEAKAGEAKAGEAKAGEAKAGEAKAGEAKAGAGKPGQGAGKPGQGEGKPGQAQQMAQLAQQQAALQQALQQQENQAQQQQANAQAAQELQQAAQKTGELAATDQQLPQAAQQALQQAMQAMMQASAQAAAQNTPPAQAQAQAAQQALAQAQASVAMAQAGAKPGQGKPGQGKPGEGKPGEGKPGKPGNKPGPGNEMAAKAGSGDRQDTNSNVQDGGPRRDQQGGGQFLGLPARDRQTILQTRSEKYPEEYGKEIEQYMQNLADDGK